MIQRRQPSPGRPTRRHRGRRRRQLRAIAARAAERSTREKPQRPDEGGGPTDTRVLVRSRGDRAGHHHAPAKSRRSHRRARDEMSGAAPCAWPSSCRPIGTERRSSDVRRPVHRDRHGLVADVIMIRMAFSDTRFRMAGTGAGRVQDCYGRPRRLCSVGRRAPSPAPPVDAVPPA